MLRLLVSGLVVTFLSSPLLVGPASAATPHDSAESLEAAWHALPRRARARVFEVGFGPGDARHPPRWLGFGRVGRNSPYCGFAENGTASIRIGVRWATRRATERAIGRIGIEAYREGGVVVAHLTRAQILAVALLRGVVWIRPDGCSWPNHEPVFLPR